MKLLFIILLIFSLEARASLKETSEKINKDLPEVYDPVTKLVTTTVENNNLIFHFIVDANQGEFDRALPKVKAQVLKTICKSSRERKVLKTMKTNVVYRYENVKGQSLGEFLVKPEHCR